MDRKHCLLTLALLLPAGMPGLSARAQLLSGTAQGLPAGAQIYLSMDEVVAATQERNAQIDVARIEERIAQADYRQTDAVFLPQVSASYSALVTTNPLNAFGFLLQQGIATPEDFAPEKLNNPGATHHFGTSVNVQLPLLNLDKMYMRKGARMQAEVQRHRLAHTGAYLAFEARRAYSQLQFAYALRDVLLSTLADARQIHRSVSNFQAQGLVQQSDVLQAQVQVNTVESALAKAESGIENASAALRLLMGQAPEGGRPFRVDSLTQVMAAAGAPALPESRPDLQAMKTAADAARLMAASERLALLPTVNAFGSYQLNDKKAFGFRKNAYMAGISLSWNLFSGLRQQAKIKSARLTSQKMEREWQQLRDKSRLELDKTRRDLLDHQHDIVKHRASVSQAAEALRILNNRHREGLASTTDCLTAQALLSQQRIALAQAVLAYNITHYYLQFISSTPQS